MIGFVQVGDSNQKEILLISQFAYAKKVPFCHFRLDAIDSCMAGKPLIAKRWNGDGYEDFETDLPKYVDRLVSIHKKSARMLYGNERIGWLASHTKVLQQTSFHKDELMHAMILNGLGQYAIPSFPVKNYYEIVKELRCINPAIIKPVHGKQGLFVYKLFKKEQALYAEDQHGVQHFTEAFCENYYNNIAKTFGGEVILQPFLDFRYDNDRVMDFRLLRQRGADGSWEEVATFGRIGSNAITSNFHTGGSMIEADMALRAIAPEKAAALLDEIMMLGEKLPLLAEKYYGENAFCIGFDIAVDRTTLQPYVMESNLTPGLRFIQYQYADHRVNYYKYLLSKE